MGERKIQTPARLLAKVIWQLRKTESFDSLADLADRVKFECAKLKISCTPDELTDAIRLIESNTPLVPDRHPKRTNPKHQERQDDNEPVSREQAAAILAKLKAQTAPKPMPKPARPIDTRRLRLILDAIVMTKEHCDQLERDMEKAE